MTETGTPLAIAIPEPEQRLSASDGDERTNKPEQTAVKTTTRSTLSKQAAQTLKTWFYGHFHDPYPTEDEKKQLCEESGIAMNQVNTWFINARRRLWKNAGESSGEKRKAAAEPHGMDAPKRPNLGGDSGGINAGASHGYEGYQQHADNEYYPTIVSAPIMMEWMQRLQISMAALHEQQQQQLYCMNQLIGVMMSNGNHPGAGGRRGSLTPHDYNSIPFAAHEKQRWYANSQSAPVKDERAFPYSSFRRHSSSTVCQSNTVPYATYSSQPPQPPLTAPEGSASSWTTDMSTPTPRSTTNVHPMQYPRAMDSQPHHQE